MQRNKHTETRNKLSSEWLKNVNDIYKKYFGGKSKAELKKYQDCISVIISSQLRQLIIRSIKEYAEFIKSFKKENYKEIGDCLIKNLKPTEKLEEFKSRLFAFDFLRPGNIGIKFKKT